MAERTEPTAASFSSSRRSCACGAAELGDGVTMLVRAEDFHMVHGDVACLSALRQPE